MNINHSQTLQESLRTHKQHIHPTPHPIYKSLQFVLNGTYFIISHTFLSTPHQVQLYPRGGWELDCVSSYLENLNGSLLTDSPFRLPMCIQSYFLDNQPQSCPMQKQFAQPLITQPMLGPRLLSEVSRSFTVSVSLSCSVSDLRHRHKLELGFMQYVDDIQPGRLSTVAQEQVL